MIKTLIYFTCIMALITSSFTATAQTSWYLQDVWKNEDRAYQWYPDGQKRKPVRNNQAQDNRPNELVQFELMQKRLDESRKIAIMSPTPENLRQYIQLQELAMNQAASFTDQWQRTIWQNPDLDYSLKGRPTNQVAMQTWDTSRQQEKEAAIQQLAGENGILFFYRSDCQYCHAMAPILKEFSVRYKVNVMAVSLDGGPIEHFPYALPNNGIAQQLKVQAVPALFVMDTKAKEFKPLGYGVIAQSTLEDRFLAFSRAVGTIY